jgi:hypothetical protein
MATNNFFRSDLPSIHNMVQNSMTLFPKELVIATLRDFFSRDSYYGYRHDHFGYPQTPDHTNMSQDAGFHDNVTTRLFIGESYRFDVIYYPAIIVRHGGGASVPISINRERGVVKWDYTVFEDGYGNQKLFPTPSFFLFAGAFEGTLNVDIMTRDLRARDDLVDLVLNLFIDVAFDDLVKSGLVIKNASSGPPTEVLDRNDQLFRQTVTLQFRNEWHRHIPINNIIDIINLSVEFGSINPPGPIAPNLTIKLSENITEIINQL